MSDLIENLVYSAIAEWEFYAHEEISPQMHFKIKKFSKKYSAEWKKRNEALE